MRIAILYNEPVLPTNHPDYSSETGVLESVEAFSAALVKCGHESAPLGIRDSIVPFIERLERERPDAAVNFCEGFAGHSRAEPYVAGVLELLGLAYTGSTPECLALVRDKLRTKQVLQSAGIPTAPYWVIRHDEDAANSPHEVQWKSCLHRSKLFVKPAAEDASLGIDQQSVVENWGQLVARVAELQQRYGDVLIETFLDGREFNIGVVALPEIQTLPIAEIEFQTGKDFRWPIVTYDSKWTARSAGYQATPVRCPAAIDEALAGRLREISLAAFRATGCRDYARIDLRTDKSGGVYVLEVNANPDAAPSAGLARALGVAGFEYETFATGLIETTLCRKSGGNAAPARQALPDASREELSCKIRGIRSEDKALLLEIVAACQLFRADEIQVADEVLSEASRDGGGHYQVLVAECDSRVVAWSCHGLVPLSDATYDLYWIAVHPSFQGRRVGRALLMRIEQELRALGARWLLAETSSSAIYDKTRTFYQKNGFVVVGDVPDFYRSGDGRITFGKRVNALLSS